jgi:PilZ domain
MDNRRHSARRRCLLGARVVFNARASTMSCTVKNLSETGALLVFGETPLIPEMVELLLDNRRTVAPARVVWRQDTKVGISFKEQQLMTDLAAIAPGLLMDVASAPSGSMH